LQHHHLSKGKIEMKLAQAIKGMAIILFANANLLFANISGKLTDLNGTPLVHFLVSSKKTQAQTYTTTDGSWEINATTKIDQNRGPRIPRQSNQIFIQTGRIEIEFLGYTAKGVIDKNVPKYFHNTSSSRAESSISDTLVFSSDANGLVATLPITSIDTAGILVAGDLYTSGVWNRWKNPAITYQYIRDLRDGQIYPTIQIGTQTWIAKNLDYKADSSWWPFNRQDSGSKYGRLYTWAATMNLPDSCNKIFCTLPDSCRSTGCKSYTVPQLRGNCPIGWHIPSATEWRVLADYAASNYAAGSDDGGTYLKSQVGWSSNGVDNFGFWAMPAGYYLGALGVMRNGKDGNWWTSSEYPDAFGSSARSQSMGEYVNIDNYYDGKDVGYSVRCIENY